MDQRASFSHFLIKNDQGDEIMVPVDCFQKGNKIGKKDINPSNSSLINVGEKLKIRDLPGETNQQKQAFAMRNSVTLNKRYTITGRERVAITQIHC